MIERQQEQAGEQEPRIHFEGRPNDPDRQGERTLFKRFADAFFRKTRGRWEIKVGPLALVKETEQVPEPGDLERAQAAEVRAKAALVAAQAAEAQARLDDPQLRAIRVNEELRRIFSDPNAPDAVKALQAANLMDADPHLAAQFERVQEVYDRLRIIRGLRAEVLPPPGAGEQAGPTGPSLPPGPPEP